jgi:hypothetical protein
VLVFADNSNETAAGYANAMLISDRSWTATEIAALGGPTAIMVQPGSSALRTLAVSIAGSATDVTVDQPQPTRRRSMRGTNEVGDKHDKLRHQ